MVGRVVVLCLLLGGCTSVRVAQRDNCWVRQTMKWGQVTEELGPCARPQPAWVEDRFTRLVQECIAQDDHRWQGRALAAWSRREEPPAAEDPAVVRDRCAADAARIVLADNEKLGVQMESLSARLGDLTADRQEFVGQNKLLAGYLGEAAIKPAGSATATANASGDSSSNSDNQSESRHASDVASSMPPATILPGVQPIIVPVPAGQPAPTVAVKKASVRKPAPKPEPAVKQPEPASAACECPPTQPATAKP